MLGHDNLLLILLHFDCELFGKLYKTPQILVLKGLTLINVGQVVLNFVEYDYFEVELSPGI